MQAPYNQFAGQSVDRLAALSDGVFAIAMTLLVLDLRPTSAVSITSDLALLANVLGPLAPRLLAYLMSFTILGIFWVGQQTQLNQFQRTNRNLAWIHLGFLLAVTLMPFSTSLLATYIHIKLALVIYWLNILMLGVMLFISRRYSARAGLLKDEITAEIQQVMDRRIIIAQALYAAGMALCLIFNSTTVGLVAMVLVQLNYVFAPRVRWLYKL